MNPVRKHQADDLVIPMEIQAKQHDWFVTRLWEYDLSALSQHFPLWREKLEQLRAESPRPAGRSNRAGWNSEPFLFTLPEFAPLLRVARHVFAAALQQMGVVQRDFKMVAWANVHDTDSYNISHTHPAMALSGCFYLSVPEGAGPIVFHDPRPGAMHSPFQGKGVNNAQQVAMRPKEGTLLVFPNWLEHRVDPNEALSARMAIAMNASLIEG